MAEKTTLKAALVAFNRKNEALQGQMTSYIGLQFRRTKKFSYGKIDEASSIPSRTIKKWFDVNEKTRASPSLKNTQACLEALGQSLIAVRPSVTLGEGEYDYSIYRVRRELLEKRIEQSAKLQSMSPDELIEKSTAEYKMITRLGPDWPGPAGGGAPWHV